MVAGRSRFRQIIFRAEKASKNGCFEAHVGTGHRGRRPVDLADAVEDHDRPQSRERCFDPRDQRESIGDRNRRVDVADDRSPRGSLVSRIADAETFAAQRAELAAGANRPDRCARTRGELGGEETDLAAGFGSGSDHFAAIEPICERGAEREVCGEAEARVRGNARGK